jgi:hypothetical protein
MKVTLCEIKTLSLRSLGLEQLISLTEKYLHQSSKEKSS